MSVEITLSATARRRATARGRTAFRLLAPLVGFAVVVVGVVGVRTAIARHQAADHAAAAATAAARPFPTSSSIEQTWGVRFTAVRVLADGSDVEMRYTALDSTKDGRLHSGNIADLPYLIAEDTGATVRSNSLMLNLHSSHLGDDRNGGTYSLIYGDSNGAIVQGGLVTIVLVDGLRLQHVPVT